MATPEKPNYKKHGFIPQWQKGLLVMRIRNRAGNMTAADLRKVADLAERYGNGRVHVTTRQAVEIPGVKEEFFEQALKDIIDLGLLPAVCGPRIRPIAACPGNDTCPYGLVNTRVLGEKLDEQFVGMELPAKTKIAISGCPNSCTKPQGNDIGLKGVVEPLIVAENCVGCGLCVRRCPVSVITVKDKQVEINKKKCVHCGLCVAACPKQALIKGRHGYHIYIGGKGGRLPRQGRPIAKFVAEQEVDRYLAAILSVYETLGNGGERLSRVLERAGWRVLKQAFQKRLITT